MQQNGKNIPIDLLSAQKLAYEPCGFSYNSLVLEAESQDYGACAFKMNSLRITFRVAKITPTKTGQFVTLWKRNEVGGPIMPFDISDPFDFVIVSVRNGNHFGQFVFPKLVSYEKGFIAKEGKGGKRAMRVYPPWVVPDSVLAQKTQAWQVLYFFEIEPNFDKNSAMKLFDRAYIKR